MPIESVPGLSIAVDQNLKIVSIGGDAGFQFKLADPIGKDEEPTVRMLRERIRCTDGRKLTLDLLAAITKLNLSTVKNYEYGTSNINLPLRTLLFYSACLQVTTGQLWAAAEQSRIRNDAEETRDFPILPNKRRKNKII